MNNQHYLTRKLFIIKLNNYGSSNKKYIVNLQTRKYVYVYIAFFFLQREKLTEKTRLQLKKQKPKKYKKN